MTSLWEKINQRLHAIVDRALEAHSMALYDQYIRDVEAYRHQVESSAATMYAGIQANRRRLAQHQADLAQLDRRIDETILAAGEEPAHPLQIEFNVQQELVATTEAQIAHQEADYQRLLAGRQETEERLILIQGERPAVEGLLAAVRAGQLVETIELTLGKLAQLGQESAVGRIANGILRRFDEAELRWQQAAASIGADAAALEAEKIQVEDQLAERMRRLGLEGDGG